MLLKDAAKLSVMKQMGKQWCDNDKYEGKCHYLAAQNDLECGLGGLYTGYALI